ncbi:MAG: hypothetical protein LC104_07110 [Bacteroidales bacterium]|nr:hypothetical protein [Bacteroidales bacterium]
MSVFWFRLHPAPPQRNVVLLDVSRAAEGFRPVLLSLVEGLAEELPEPVQPEIAFLGGTARYPLQTFLQRSEELFSHNAGRGRVLAPTLEALPSPWPVRVVLFAAHPVFDLGDWLQNPWQNHFAVVALDPTIPIAGADQDKSLNDLDMPALARLVNPQPRETRLLVAGGLPVSWPTSGWRCEPGRAVYPGPLAAPVRLGWCVPSEREPLKSVVETIWENGLRTRQKPTRTDAPALGEWQPLTGPELTRLDAWRMRRAVPCPNCQHDHPPGQVFCANGESGLLPSLAGCVSGGFVRVRIKTFQASMFPVREQVVVHSETTATGRNADGQPIQWEYDSTRQCWVAGRVLSLFDRIHAEEYLLTLPPVPPSAGGPS